MPAGWSVNVSEDTPKAFSVSRTHNANQKNELEEHVVPELTHNLRLYSTLVREDIKN